jgi:outer membrane lipoprotein-sorting protein
LKIIIILSFIFLCSCSTKTQPTDTNALLMSIKNYECSMNITFHSNKNLITCSAKQIYNYPDNYSLNFSDNQNLSISYSNKMLTLCNSFLNLSESYNEYENLNTNPLFLSYFLNSYFNSNSKNILECNFEKVSINLPYNNSYLFTATLILNNNIPYSLTYYDKNNKPKLSIIYNKFSFESS